MRYIIRILAIFLLPTVALGNKTYFFENVTQDIEMSNVGINTICEDDKGFVWFGGINGLYYHNTIAVKKVDLYKDKKGATKPIKIIKLYKDSDNRIWVCTEKGLYKYIETQNRFKYINLPDTLDKDTSTSSIVDNIIQLDDQLYLLQCNNKIYKYNDNDSSVVMVKTSFRGNITLLHKDENEIIYLGTYDGRVYISKDNLEKTTLLYHSTKRRISAICKDGNKYYIGYTWLGVDIINSKGFKIGELSSNSNNNNHTLPDDHVREIIRRKNGEIWIATYAGIVVIYDGKQNLLDSKAENNLPHRTVFTMCTGTNDKVWVGTQSGGVACYSEYNYSFNYMLLDYPRDQADKSHTSAFCEDNRGYIWIGSEEEGGIKVFDPKTNSFIDELSEDIDQSIRGVKYLSAIDPNLIAIAMNYSNHIILYNYQTHRIEKRIKLPLKADPGLRGVLNYKGKLWIYDRTTLLTYDLNTHEIETRYRASGIINALFFDSAHNTWIGTSKGLFVIEAGEAEAKALDAEESVLDINEASIYSICEAQGGNIWIGTMGQGAYVYSIDSLSLQHAPGHKQTADSDIYSLLKDKHNNIWYITNKGVYCYETTQGRHDYYGTKDDLLKSQTRINASLCSKDGTIYIGSKYGFNSINPSSIKKNPIIPSVYLASMTINNKPFLEEDEGLASLSIFNQKKTIILNADENTLGFKAISNNYIKSQKNRYKYRLLNYENEWRALAQNKDIVYTKIPPGDYIFEAYGANNDMVWSKHPYRLNIKIRPPYFKRWYALLFYFIIATVILVAVYKELKLKLKLRKEITEERYKVQANEQVHSERIQFFTNISHELRTPLSLVISPLRHLLDKKGIDEETEHLLKVADRNAKRLLKIADQALDFRLLEVGKLEPHFVKYDIIQLVQDVHLYFEQQIIDHKISFTFTSVYNRIELTIDVDMIEKTVYNLLSNALKFTPEGESITISINEKVLTEKDYSDKIYKGHKIIGKALCIAVKDTGVGIKHELLPHIFERFTKGSESHETSTGIGLHLCKEYSKMNKGNVQLISEEGKGTTFTLNLPIADNTNYKSGEPKQLARYEQNETNALPSIENSTKSYSYSIMLVEDNSELSDYLKTFLKSYYQVIIAKKGEQALSLLEDIIPDLIITDVSMPGISGIELTKQLKKNYAWRHIPIITMTAYIDRKYQMESILCGADAFFTKPIDETILLAQIKSILQKRKDIPQSVEPHQNLIEKDSFIQKAEKLVEQNLQNTQFEIANMLQELNISKTSLTRKIKEETQLNPSGFIRDIRLKNAVKLLSTNKFNIDEIADYVGFNSSSYFIRSFKEKYGLTPNEYRRKMNS